MKIGPLDTKPAASVGPPAAAERKADGARPASGTEDRPSGASAQVQLSSAAAALANQAVGDTSFDQAKVDRIAQAIRDGKFEVNADAIADKLIVNARELLGRAGG